MNKQQKIASKLIKACQRNDYKAQRELYNQYVDRLYFIIRRYVNDDYFIKNILQDVFLKVFNHIGKYDPKKASFNTWIHTIAIRESINHLKKKSLEFTSLDFALEQKTNVADILSQLQAEEVLKCISNIPEKYSVIFNLYEIDGYSHQEIAALLNIGASTSRSYLTRAKQMIQDQLKQTNNV